MCIISPLVDMTLVKTAGSFWLKCKKKDAHFQWLYLMKRYMPSADTVRLIL